MKLTVPPMGFNTWNTFGENNNDELVKKYRVLRMGCLQSLYRHTAVKFTELSAKLRKV